MTTKTKKRVQLRPNVHALTLRIPKDLYAKVCEELPETPLTPLILSLLEDHLAKILERKAKNA